MSQRIFRIVYCSRNRMRGTDAEVRAQLDGMLRTSRRNNGQAGVTGALFFNTVFFAQALEGDYVQVQRVFERLQNDPRHDQLAILHCGYAAGRDFGDWSMGYAGASSGFALPFENASRHETALMGTSRSGENVLRFLREIVVRQQVWALPERQPAAFSVSSAGLNLRVLEHGRVAPDLVPAMGAVSL